jgi:ABC-type microcin C transport system duplicated ATPase subunit YejF
MRKAANPALEMITLRAWPHIGLTLAPRATAKITNGLAPVPAGSIMFAGQDVTRATRAQRRTTGKDLQVVF